MDDQVIVSNSTIYSRIREETRLLVAPLSAEDMQVQTMPDVSPTKWHLAHTTWFWERFLLLPNLEGYREFNKEYNYLFNSYYEQVGERHPRPERGFLSRPSVDEVMAYRDHVDAGMASLLGANPDSISPQISDLVALGIAHEQQHQELLLTDIKHVLSRHPFAPAAYDRPAVDTGSAGEVHWQTFDGGIHRFGHTGDGFAFDNEGPSHEAILTPFALASRPVTNAEYLAFIEDGGYRTATLWLSEGWGRVLEDNWTAPLYWQRDESAGWTEFTLHGRQALQPDAPVTHLSYYEASAFAEWAGARLPEEREWELAARTCPVEGNFVRPGETVHPRAGASGRGLQQMFGDVWEWTRSAYSAYPRYRPASGAVGEYNGKFMCGQFVLRGGSCATPRGHIRPTYRNFFPPDARWQFSGVRLAKDI